MKPMKAYQKTPPLAELKYPQLASPKLDGIRCVIDCGVALSNSLKPIPNSSVQLWARTNAAVLQGLDGELMTIDGDFNDVQSTIMSVNGGHSWKFMCFDRWDVPALPFAGRVEMLKELPYIDKFELVEHTVFHTPEGLQVFWDKCVAEGKEGVITRRPDSPYKYGRSTLLQGWMIKLKGWEDAEATITGYEELMRNENEAFIGELGQTKRPKCIGGLVPADTLGSLSVEWNGKRFNIGGGQGLTAAMRDTLWSMRKSLVGKTITFKYFGVSKLGVPRHPNYKGIRYDV